MAKKIIWSIVLTMVILSSSIYFIFNSLNGSIKVDIQDTRTQYYSYENEEFTLAATEYLYLYDGTHKMLAKSRNLTWYNDSNYVYVIRTSIWKDNITTIQEYVFDIANNNIENVPIKNELTCINCVDKIVQYEIRDIIYDEETKEIYSPFRFGHKFKIEWDNRSYYSKVFNQITSDKIIIKYKPIKDIELYNIRLFDPEVLKLSLNNIENNISSELNSTINISVNYTGAEEICLDIDSPNYGYNYTCGTNFSINFSDYYFRKNIFNDSSTSKNLTFTSVQNQTFWIPAHQYDEVENLSINLTGYNYSKVKLYVNNSLSSDVGEIYKGIITLNTFGGGYYTVGDTIAGTLANVVEGSCSSSPSNCSQYYDGNWSSYASLGTYNTTNVSINYTIPTYPIHNALVNFSMQATYYPPNIYCKDGTSWIDAPDYMNITLYSGPWVGSYYFYLPDICYDNEQVLEIKYGFHRYDYPFESEVKWYESSKLVSFDSIGANTFTINVSSKANVTSATANITGLLNDGIDQSMTTIYTENWSLMQGVNYTQSFTPKISNMSKLCFYLSKNNLLGYDINVSLGTAPNKSDVGTTTLDIEDIELTPSWSCVSFKKNLTVGNKYYITLRYMAPTWSSAIVYWFSTPISTNIYPYGEGYILYPGLSPVEMTNDFTFIEYAFTYPSNITLEIGKVDGTYEWNYSGSYKTMSVISDFSSELNSYLENCTSIDGYCHVPAYVTSDTAGNITFKRVEINYTTNPNPISLNKTLIQNYLNNSINYTNVPIKVESDRQAIIQVDDIKYDYAGGNKSISIIARTISSSLNLTRYIKYYYSDFKYSLPRGINYLEFIPKNSNSKNVYPYGQTNSTPILNVSTTQYYNKTMNVSFYLNESSSCINITIGVNPYKSNGTLITNNTWINVLVNRNYLNNSGIWMWADYNCSSSGWSWWVPNLYIRGCCHNCGYNCSSGVD